MVILNRAVARAELDGPQAALADLQPLEAEPRMRSYQPYWAAKAHLCSLAGDTAGAREALALAIGLSTDEAVKGYLLAAGAARRRLSQATASGARLQRFSSALGSAAACAESARICPSSRASYCCGMSAGRASRVSCFVLRVSCLCLLAALTSWLPAARASELSWQGQGGCAERDQLLFQIEQALGAPLAKVAALQFAVHIERSEPPLVARLSVVSAAGEAPKQRVLSGQDCSKLVDTLTVAVALALGAHELEQESLRAAASAAAPSVPELPPAQQEPVVDVPPPVELAPESGLRGGALALLVGDAGSLPAGGLGAALGVEVGWSAVQLRLTGTMFFDQRVGVALPGGARGGADVNLAVGGLLVCSSTLSTPSARLSLPLCAGVELGRLAGVGRGVPNAREGAVPWVAPLVEGGMYWRIPGTALRVAALVSAVVPLNRDRFVVRGLGPVHQPSSVAGRGSLGIELFFD